jgi:hypothetical protein
MLQRRTLLAGLGAAVTLPALSRIAQARPARAAAAFPLHVANSTGAFPDDAIWIYVVGTDLASGAQVRLAADGTMVPVSESDNTSDGYTDYAVRLDQARFTVPAMSGRIYLALGDKLKIKAVVDGSGRPALQYPAGWVEADPNYPVQHDFVEFTHDDRGMHCNTTMVDQFGAPLAIRLEGTDSQTTGTLVPGGRSRIFEQIRAQSGFGDLVVDDLRVIAPGHGIDAGRFPADYLDSYVNEVWQHYSTTDLRVHTPRGVFTGRVGPDAQLRFVSDQGEATAPFSRPSTRDVFFCDGALAAPNDGVTGAVAAQLGAGFNRSVLHLDPDQPTSDPARFYTHPKTNHYARVMHANTEDGKAYGFAFDDVAGFAAYIEDPAPTACTVTVTPF